MAKGDIEKVIDHLPPETTYLTFTGGEVSTRRVELVHALRYANAKKSSKFPNAVIAVETNGSWITDESSTLGFLSLIIEAGATRLILAGLDNYHFQQGLDTNRLDTRTGPLHRALSKLSTDRNGQRLEIKFNGANAGVLPFGRGASLPVEDHTKRMYCAIFPDMGSKPQVDEINIGPDGNVYLCPWGVAPSIGSAINEPISVLIDKALIASSVTTTLIREGPVAAAQKSGLPIPEDTKKEDPSCRECHSIFSIARDRGLIA